MNITSVFNSVNEYHYKYWTNYIYSQQGFQFSILEILGFLLECDGLYTNISYHDIKMSLSIEPSAKVM